jgi:tetratricopeptide (TPR) repeat protein
MGRAVTDLSRAVEIDPTYELALYNLGYAFDMLAGKETDASARRSRYADALKYYEKAIDQDPQDKEAYNNHGCVLIELDDDARNLLQAVEDLSTAIAVDPRYDLAYYNRARARIQGGETAAAIADLTQAIEINPKFAQAYSERGLIHLNSERPLVAESIEDFTLAIKANPTLAVAYYNRGIAYREIKRLDLAVADLRVSLALGEADAEAELRKMGVDPKATR